MNEKLKIAIGDFAPFTIKKDGKFSGFEIELWEAIAREARIDNFEYEQMSFPKIIPAVADKKFDIGLSGITINSKRESVVDFSHSTLDSGLLILVNKNGRGLKIKETIKAIFKEGYSLLISPLIFVLIFIVVVGHILWLAEMSAHTFAPTYIPAILESFWLVICTMSTDSFGDYVPHTWLGRVVTIFTIVGGVAIFGLLIAQITAFLAIRKIKTEISGPSDLTNKTVATVKDSTSVNSLRKFGARVVEVEMLSEAYDKLKNKEVDAVVFDAPMLIYFIEKQNDQSSSFSIVGELFEKQEYGIAMQVNSPLRERINQAILKVRESGVYDLIYRKWFGDDTVMEA